MADFVVTATRLYRLVDGKRVRNLRGDTIAEGELSAEDIERYVKADAITKTGSAEAKDALASPATVHPAEESVLEVTPPEERQASDLLAAANSKPRAVRPAKAATKEVWQRYAVESGQLSEDEAKKKTRDQLRDELH